MTQLEKPVTNDEKKGHPAPGNNPPQDLNQAFREAQKLSKEAASRRAKLPNNQPYPPDFVQIVYEWVKLDYWSPEETANLLCGYHPRRERNLPGLDIIDQRSIGIEKIILNCLGNSLEGDQVKEGRKEVKRVRADAVIPWAKSKDINVPHDLARVASAAHPDAPRLPRLNQTHEFDIAQATDILTKHCTADIEAILWVIEEFWLNTERKRRPKQAEIVAALLERYAEHGMTRNRATSIDSIVRPPQFRRGGIESTRARNT